MAELALIVCYAVESLLNPFRFALSAVHLCERGLMNLIGTVFGIWADDPHKGYRKGNFFARSDSQEKIAKTIKSDAVYQGYQSM